MIRDEEGCGYCLMCDTLANCPVRTGEEAMFLGCPVCRLKLESETFCRRSGAAGFALDPETLDEIRSKLHV